MTDVIIFIKREVKLCMGNFSVYFLPLVFWLAGFSFFGLLQGWFGGGDFWQGDKAITLMVWYLFLLFFAISFTATGLYQTERQIGFIADIILSSKSLISFTYAKWLSLVIFSGLPLLLLATASIYLLGYESWGRFFWVAGLFLLHSSLVMNFISALVAFTKNGGLLMLVLLLPLLLPSMLWTRQMLLESSVAPIIYFALANFLFFFAILPLAGAWIIKELV